MRRWRATHVMYTQFCLVAAYLLEELKCRMAWKSGFVLLWNSQSAPHRCTWCFHACAAAALVDDGGDYHNEADSTNLTSENRALSLFGHDRCWYAFLSTTVEASVQDSCWEWFNGNWMDCAWILIHGLSLKDAQWISISQNRKDWGGWHYS